MLKNKLAEQMNEVARKNCEQMHERLENKELEVVASLRSLEQPSVAPDACSEAVSNKLDLALNSDHSSKKLGPLIFEENLHE